MFTNYGETLRRRRKLVHQTLGPQVVPKYFSGLEALTKTFIRSLLTDSDNYIRHIRRYSGGLGLSIIYGYQVQSSDDKFLVLAEQCLDLLANDMAGSGLWSVDVLPFLRYLPSWLPGLSFKKKAEEYKLKITEFIEKPYSLAKENMVSLWLEIVICFRYLIIVFLVCRKQGPSSHHFVLRYSTKNLH
jgi:hypothetical protein